MTARRHARLQGIRILIFYFDVVPNGVDYQDIIDSTLYIVDLQKNAATMAKVKDEFIKEPYPASTWIGVTELVIPGTRAEIKVTARVPG